MTRYKYYITAALLFLLVMAAVFGPRKNVEPQVEAATSELSSFWHQQVRSWEPLLVGRSVDPDLLAAIMTVESAGRPDAISSAGAVGLMQVMPAEKIQGRPPTSALLDPATNVEWSIKILEEYTEMMDGNPRLGLAAYYMGPGDADSTAGYWYADKVLSLYAQAILNK